MLGKTKIDAKCVITVNCHTKIFIGKVLRWVKSMKIFMPKFSVTSYFTIIFWFKKSCHFLILHTFRQAQNIHLRLSGQNKQNDFTIMSKFSNLKTYWYFLSLNTFHRAQNIHLRLSDQQWQARTRARADKKILMEQSKNKIRNGKNKTRNGKNKMMQEKTSYHHCCCCKKLSVGELCNYAR